LFYVLKLISEKVVPVLLSEKYSVKNISLIFYSFHCQKCNNKLSQYFNGVIISCTNCLSTLLFGCHKVMV